MKFYDSNCLTFLEIFDFHIGINLYVTGILYFLFCFEFAVWTYLEGNEIVTFWSELMIVKIKIKETSSLGAISSKNKYIKQEPTVMISDDTEQPVSIIYWCGWFQWNILKSIEIYWCRWFQWNLKTNLSNLHSDNWPVGLYLPC